MSNRTCAVKLTKEIQRAMKFRPTDNMLRVIYDAIRITLANSQGPSKVSNLQLYEALKRANDLREAGVPNKYLYGKRKKIRTPVKAK